MKEIAQIAADAAGGDREAFEKLYQMTKRSVWYTCISLLKNEENAKDAMQNTYLAAFEKLDTLTNPEGVVNWLNRIAANKCKDYMKKSCVNREQEGMEIIENIAAGSIIPEEYVIDQAKRKVIMETLEKALSEEQYQTIILYYYIEMTAPEIAVLMECHEKTVLYRLKTARDKIREALVKYEEKNNDRLHAVVPLPFLIRLFKTESENMSVPDRIDRILLDALKGVSENHTPEGHAGYKRKRRTQMNAGKVKIILGIMGTVAVCGTMFALVRLNRQDKSAGSEETLQASEETLRAPEGSAADTSAGSGAGETWESSRLIPVIRINGSEFEMPGVTIGEMLSAGVEIGTKTYMEGPCEYEDGMLEVFDGQGFSNGVCNMVPLDDTGLKYEAYYDTQMYVSASAGGKNVDWMELTPLTPEACGNLMVKGIMITEELTADRSFVTFCGGIGLGMTKKEIDDILGDGYSFQYCRPERLDGWTMDWSDEDYERNYIENATESHYRSPELTMVVKYDGVGGDAKAYSILFYVNEVCAEDLSGGETRTNFEDGNKEKQAQGELQGDSDGLPQSENGSQEGVEAEPMIVMSEEIADASFGSGLIQVNNEVFLQGGYLTVEEFVEKYRDAYQIKYSNGANYGSSDRYMVYYEKPEIYEYRDADDFLLMYPHAGYAEDGGHRGYGFQVNIANMTSPDAPLPIEQAIVVSIVPFCSRAGGELAPMWTPGGFAAREGNFAPENERYGLYCTNTGLTVERLKEWFGELGYEEYSAESTFRHTAENCGKYKIGEESIVLLAAGETNLIGAVPVYSYVFRINPNTGGIQNWIGYHVCFDDGR